ncbi:hypothetical protein HETIRDRAFT_329614 [Heterobasidion irregulare TC 32-1]|uniref:Signal recognition particle SRP19 subunit n=1 Tax=Heterobasidion irregulare (strain TC 32-1) TaxID=747525 RepID=W4JQR7_HETIT|nr:uncharacterized protein HETIRDRAFT_329614 [Heterobasidion irregulare TC 32-1]ETW75804.1 hypothetical protein HETIRDRAFT_329614 [Heterobasidion irregulare TC 32-1]
MSRRAAIIEEFDDDVDLPLPSRPLPNTGTRGAILQEITDVDDASDDDEALDLVEPTAGPASPQGPSQGTPVVTDITPYKKWTCIYPIYIDAKQPYGTGVRRISREKSVWWPLSKDIADATNRLGLGTLHEVNKAHPRDWENPGRVRVQWKKEGRLMNPHIKTKKQLLEMISFQIQRIKPDYIPKPPFSYPTPATPPTSASAAKSSKPKSISSKSSASVPKSKDPAPPKQTSRPLPNPPEPLPSPASRMSVYSPALPSGVLVDTVKAGMNAEGAAPGVAGGGAAGKGKRKVVRVRA